MSITKLLCVVVVGFVGCFTSGCAGVGESIGEIRDLRDRAAEIRTDLGDRRDEIGALRGSIADGHPDAPGLDAALARVSAKISALDAAIIHADQTIAEAQNPTDPMTIAVDGLSRFVPAPIQAPLVLGSALIVTLLRSGRLRESARSIVESIDHATRKDPAFAQALRTNADSIRTIQTHGARKLVNKWSTN